MGEKTEVKEGRRQETEGKGKANKGKREKDRGGRGEKGQRNKGKKRKKECTKEGAIRTRE